MGRRSMLPRPNLRGFTLDNGNVPLSAPSLIEWLGGHRGRSGIQVSETSSLGLPAVYRAVSLLAGSIASLPLKPYVEGTKDPAPAVPILDCPHPEMTQMELWETALAQTFLWGNAYLLKTRTNGGEIVRLTPLDPSKVRIEVDAPTGAKVFLMHGMAPMTSFEVMHLKCISFDGIRGLSPVGACRVAVELGLAAEEFGARLFGNGTMLSGILTTDHNLNEEQASAIKRRWQQLETGLDKAHDIAVLDNGAKFTPLSIPPEDAQFIEVRKFQVVEIARMYGIPPHMLGDVEKSTSWGAGIESQTLAWIKFTLKLPLTRMEQRISLELCPKGVSARYDTNEFSRGDTLARYQAYAIGRQWGWLSYNQIAEWEGLPDRPEGDTLLSPLNMTPSDQPPDIAPGGAP